MPVSRPLVRILFSQNSSAWCLGLGRAEESLPFRNEMHRTSARRICPAAPRRITCICSSLCKRPNGGSMTLILSLACMHQAIQVVDRRLTSRRSANTKPSIYDDESNKTIIWTTSNAILSISYTGPAFIRGIPTDQWIVESLLGRKFERKKAWINLGGRPIDSFKKSAGFYLNRLASDINSEATSNKDIRNSFFEISATGYQRIWNMWRPVLVEISKENEIHRVKHGSRRYDFLKNFPNRFSLSISPGQNISPDLIDSCRLALRALKPRQQDEMESILRNLLSSVSQRLIEVGPDCLSVLIPYPIYDRPLRVRFFADTARTKLAKDSMSSEPVSYAPWILLPDGILYPHLLNQRCQEWSFGSLKILYENMAFPDTLPQRKFPIRVWGQTRRGPPLS